MNWPPRENMPMTPEQLAGEFSRLRPLLFSIAYRMLGSAMDAEDIVQETYLRWQATETPVASPKAYLTAMVTNLCIDYLRSAQARRESCGPRNRRGTV